MTDGGFFLSDLRINAGAGVVKMIFTQTIYLTTGTSISETEFNFSVRDKDARNRAMIMIYRFLLYDEQAIIDMENVTIDELMKTLGAALKARVDLLELLRQEPSSHA